MTLTPLLKNWLIDNKHCPSTLTDETLYTKKSAELLATGELSAEKFSELTGGKSMSTVSPEKVFKRNDGDRIRVKDPSEQYDDTRFQAKHAKTGRPVYDPVHQRECCTMSEGSKARAGVLLKHLANKSGVVNNPLSEHERGLLDEVCERQAWCGKIGGEHYDYIGGDRNIKALIDDSTSGGLEIVPIEFDSDIVTFPLLGGELFPSVDLKPVPRGRRIEGASIGTPTLDWGGADNSAIDLFTTTSMVAAIDTTIFGVDGSIEIGRDFMSDSPVEVGGTLTGLVGERLMNELDKIIANGNGSTQPTGLFQAAGVSTVSTDNGGSGPATLNDYISLLFALPKQYRNRNLRVAFISNDTSYQRSRQIKIDTASPSTDQRPALAPLTTINDYESLGWAHKIENNLANTVAGVAALAKYRMYRRLGLEIRFESGGKELARNNLMLMVYRARFGGKLVDANAFAKWTDGQS